MNRTIGTFSSWVPAADLANLSGSEHRGLYVVGRFPGAPSAGPADPLAEEVLYIGETHGPAGSILERVQLFVRAARSGTAKHSGGKRFHRDCGTDLTGLHVAALPVIESDPDRLLDVIFAREKALIAAYEDKWGRKPICNRSSGQSRRRSRNTGKASERLGTHEPPVARELGAIPADLTTLISRLSADDIGLLRALASRLAAQSRP